MLLAMLGEVAESGSQPRGTGDGFETHGCCDEERSQRSPWMIMGLDASAP